jgi:uncharacterized peroxidase-related enzyme
MRTAEADRRKINHNVENRRSGTMVQYAIHTMETAPEASRETMAAMKKKMGLMPNIFAILAESPTALKGYAALAGTLEGSILTPAERLLAMLVASDENGCQYCTAAHSTQAKGAGLDASVVAALREGRAIGDPKLAALAAFTRLMVEKRGWAEEAELEAFVAAGYEKGVVFEVIAIVALKTITNYLNHVAGTPVDAASKPKIKESPIRREGGSGILG